MLKSFIPLLTFTTLKLLCLSVIFFLIFTGTAGSSTFSDNERLRFRIRWSFIPAGEVTLEIKPPTKINAIPSKHFVLTATTYPAIDIIYKLRERIDSYTNLQISQSLLYQKQQSGKTERDVTVSFDWKNGLAQYSNFGLKNNPIKLEPGTIDPLSALYFLRTQNLETKARIEKPITDGKKVVWGDVKILGREKITLNDITYDTYKLEPNMKDVRGVFEKSKNAKMYIWLTADERKMLVKLKSKVVVGSFVVELIEHNYPEKTKY